MGVIRRKSLDHPDELRQFELGTGEMTRLGSSVIGRAVLQPGWRWSTHMRPVMGTSSCPVHHVQVVLSGQFGVRMDDGEEVTLVPNDVVEVPPGHDAWVIGDVPAVLLDVAGNIDAIGVRRERSREVTTLLMTDIVDSTAMASRLGDAKWRQQLQMHNRVVRGQLRRFDGREVNTTGDGFLATFASAVAAVRCAQAIRGGVRELGLEIRAGVHTGEVEVIDDDVGGVAVHATARIMALAGPSEILVSAVTAALTGDDELSLEEHGRHELKGISHPMEVRRLAE